MYNRTTRKKKDEKDNESDNYCCISFKKTEKTKKCTSMSILNKNLMNLESLK